MGGVNIHYPAILLRVSFGYPSFDPSLWGKHRVLSLVKKARASFSFELKIMGIYCQTHPDCICFAALIGLMGVTIKKEWANLQKLAVVSTSTGINNKVWHFMRPNPYFNFERKIWT